MPASVFAASLVLMTVVAAVGFGIAMNEAMDGDDRADFPRMCFGGVLVLLGVLGMTISAISL